MHRTIVNSIFTLAFHIRLWLYQHNIRRAAAPPLPAVSVGNITAGGTGKTPVVAWLVKSLCNYGFQPAIISRGYRRKSRGFFLVSDGSKLYGTVEYAGDEPYWYATQLKVPVAVDKNRIRAAEELSKRFPLDVLILDDAFQHWHIQRQCDILVVDSHTLTEKFFLPAGGLRAPKTTLQWADILLARSPVDCATVHETHPFLKEKRCFSFTPKLELPKRYFGKSNGTREHRYYLFAGIAHPAQFFEAARQQHLVVCGQQAFRDHHWYTRKDLVSLLQKARNAAATALLTTEKDAVRLTPYRELLDTADIPIYVLPMRIAFPSQEQEQKCIEMIIEHLKNAAHPAYGSL